FILVPSKARKPVTEALLARGFQFANGDTGYRSKGPVSEAGSPPVTPPPETVAELQTRTFNLLRKKNVTPNLEDGLRLVQCSGREADHVTHDFVHHSSRRPTLGNGRFEQTWLDNVDTKLYTATVSALVSQ